MRQRQQLRYGTDGTLGQRSARRRGHAGDSAEGRPDWICPGSWRFQFDSRPYPWNDAGNNPSTIRAVTTLGPRSGFVGIFGSKAPSDVDSRILNSLTQSQRAEPRTLKEIAKRQRPLL